MGWRKHRGLIVSRICVFIRARCEWLGGVIRYRREYFCHTSGKSGFYLKLKLLIVAYFPIKLDK